MIHPLAELLLELSTAQTGVEQANISTLLIADGLIPYCQ